MKRTITTLTFILLLTLSSEAQKTFSKLYNTKGELFADTTLTITKKQLNKWIVIEDTLTKRILDKLHYPQLNLEAEVSGKVIISFTLDTSGNFNDFKLENFICVSDDSSHTITKSFKKSAVSATNYYSSYFGFKSDKKSIEKYYLPFDFIVPSKVTERIIKKGWLTLAIKNYDPKDNRIQY